MERNKLNTAERNEMSIPARAFSLGRTNQPKILKDSRMLDGHQNAQRIDYVTGKALSCNSLLKPIFLCLCEHFTFY